LSQLVRGPPAVAVQLHDPLVQRLPAPAVGSEPRVGLVAELLSHVEDVLGQLAHVSVGAPLRGGGEGQPAFLAQGVRRGGHVLGRGELAEQRERRAAVVVDDMADAEPGELVLAELPALAEPPVDGVDVTRLHLKVVPALVVVEDGHLSPFQKVYACTISAAPCSSFHSARATVAAAGIMSPTASTRTESASRCSTACSKSSKAYLRKLMRAGTSLICASCLVSWWSMWRTG